jgi:hypothetical protein
VPVGLDEFAGTVFQGVQIQVPDGSFPVNGFLNGTRGWGCGPDSFLPGFCSGVREQWREGAVVSRIKSVMRSWQKNDTKNDVKGQGALTPPYFEYRGKKWCIALRGSIAVVPAKAGIRVSILNGGKCR